MLFAGAPGLDEALPEDVEETLSELGEKAWEGDFEQYIAVLGASSDPAKELNTPKDVLNFSRITPFCLLLERIYMDGTLSKGQAAAAAFRKSVEAGADWRESFARGQSSTAVYPFALLLRSLIREKKVGSAMASELIALALASGARWVNQDGPPAFADCFLFLDLLKAFCEFGTWDAASLQLLADSLQGVASHGQRPVMCKLFEGGGTMFSNVVTIAMRHDLFGTEAGDALLNFCYAHGARWECTDGWNQSAFLELISCAVTSRRCRGKRSREENFQVVKGILEREKDPARLWNVTEDRGAQDQACESTFYEMLLTLSEEGLVGQPLARAYIFLAESYGARWDGIAWNYSPPWEVYQKGRLTNFHRLVDRLGPLCHHPDGLSILSGAVEAGADFAIDDPNLPGRKRYVANLPRLLWAPRRQLLRRLALLRAQRAEADGVEAWLARLARSAGERWQVGHPIVRLVFSFLPRVPAVLGYDFSTRGYGGPPRTMEARPRSAEEGF